MEFLLEFSIGGAIIGVFLVTFYANNLKSNVRAKESEIDSLTAQLTKDSSSYRLKEDKLNKDIETLRSEFTQSHSFIAKREAALEDKETQYLDQLKSLKTSLLEEQEARKKILSQKKSSEVRIGNISEKLAPFLDDFEFDPEKCIFLGQPIDYISFGEDEITFIEVKSGKSQLSAKQRHIRDLVKAKHISWKEFRII